MFVVRREDEFEYGAVVVFIFCVVFGYVCVYVE